METPFKIDFTYQAKHYIGRVTPCQDESQLKYQVEFQEEGAEKQTIFICPNDTDEAGAIKWQVERDPVGNDSPTDDLIQVIGEAIEAYDE